MTRQPGVESDRPLRTAFWEKNEVIELTWPREWSVSVRWPQTPPPLSAQEIADALRTPVQLPPIAEACQGKKKPLVIVDDLTRATPAARILEPLLEELQAAGISPEQVTILVATGTHSPPAAEMLERKLGTLAASTCRVVVHRDSADCRPIGRTTFGTPIIADHEVLEADWIVGIGGVYPNNTAGFGGGSKLALGVMARETITHLHLKHGTAGWGHRDDSLRFRRDLDEIAEAIGLRAMISVHVDAEGRPVRVVLGDHRATYRQEAAWAASTYLVEGPGDADVVVANAYPNDATLSAVRHKAYAPLRAARPDATRLALASCHGGPGGHGLFPLVDTRTPAQRLRVMFSVMPLRQFAGTLLRGVRRRLSRAPRGSGFTWPVLLYRPGTGAQPELPTLSGLEVAPSWEAVVDTIARRHASEAEIRVVVYPCAPLQVLRPTADEGAATDRT